MSFILIVKPGIRDFCLFTYDPLRLFLYLENLNLSLGEILGYSAITDYVLTCRFSGSIPV